MKKSFFTAKEARSLNVHPAVLSHYVKSGRLKRIGRGLYQSTEHENIEAFRWEDLIEAVHTVKDGIICLTSALAVYELTEEIPRQHWIAIRHGTSTKKTTKLKVVRFRNVKLGKIEIKLEGVKTSIFDRERTIIDAFRFLSRETAIKALKMALHLNGKKRIDVIKLQEYAKELHVDITPYLMSLTL